MATEKLHYHIGFFMVRFVVVVELCGLLVSIHCIYTVNYTTNSAFIYFVNKCVCTTSTIKMFTFFQKFVYIYVRVCACGYFKANEFKFDFDFCDKQTIRHDMSQFTISTMTIICFFFVFLLLFYKCHTIK